MNRSWYAVYTKPQAEKKVVAYLSKKKIENFCPHKRVITGLGNKQKIIYEPLFPSFVFVYITVGEMNEVRKTTDILNFVYWLGMPVNIKTNEIESIADFNGAYYNIQLEKTPVNAGGVFKLISEPGMPTDMGVITFTPTRVKLVLPSLGFALFAQSNTDKDYTPIQEIQKSVAMA